MKPDEIMYEWIDRYLNGQLEGEELSAFTDKLETDTTFSALVEDQKTANTIILGNRLSMVKQMMDADFKSADNKNTGTKWGLGGLLGTSIVICSLLYFSDQATPATVSTHEIEAKQKSSTKQSSDSDTQSAEHVVQQSHTKTYLSATTNTTGIKISSPADVTAYSAFESNILSEPNNHTIPQAHVVDTIHIKNQLLTTNNKIQKVDICSGVVIEAILTIDAACLHKTDGEIHVIQNSLKGGRSPYTYVLVNKANDTVRQNSTSFVSLPPGQYKLFFEDANLCFSAYKKPLYINEKSCTQPTQSFSPHAGEHFNYPVSGNSDAQITIYNKGGQIVYKTNLSKGTSEFWDGTNQNGQILPTGMYIYIIEYVSGIKETGEVVIF